MIGSLPIQPLNGTFRIALKLMFVQLSAFVGVGTSAFLEFGYIQLCICDEGEGVKPVVFI